MTDSKKPHAFVPKLGNTAHMGDCDRCGQPANHDMHWSPLSATEQAAMDARPEPDASGYDHRDNPLSDVLADALSDKQQPAQRNEWSDRLRAVDYLFSLSERKLLANALDAQAAEIAVLSDALNDQAKTIVKKDEQNAALREALEHIAENSDEAATRKQACAALEASERNPE